MFNYKQTNPQAALICSGVVDICDIGVNLGTTPCPVIVHAVKEFPLPLFLASFNTVECRHSALMAEALGMVTQEQLRLEGVIIGSFFADRIPYGYESPWAFGCNPETTYRVISPILLDKPVDASKQLSFEAARSGYSVIPPALMASGEELNLPVKSDIFHRAVAGSEFTIPLDNKLGWPLFSNDGLSQFTRLSLTCGAYIKTFVFEPENDIVFRTDELGNVVTVFSAMLGKKVALPYFKFVLKTQLI